MQSVLGGSNKRESIQPMKTLQDLQREERQRFESLVHEDMNTLTALQLGVLADYFNSLIAQAYNAGKEAVVDYIKQEVGIEPDISPVNDYVIPFSVLEAARNVE